MQWNRCLCELFGNNERHHVDCIIMIIADVRCMSFLAHYVISCQQNHESRWNLLIIGIFFTLQTAVSPYRQVYTSRFKTYPLHDGTFVWSEHTPGTCAIDVAIFSLVLVEGWTSWNCEIIGPIDHLIEWRINLNHWWDNWPGGWGGDDRRTQRRPVPVSLYPLHISHGRPRERTAVSAVRSRQPDPRAAEWPFVFHSHLFVCCHDHMTRCEAANRDDLQIRKAAANVLDEQ